MPRSCLLANAALVTRPVDERGGESSSDARSACVATHVHASQHAEGHRLTLRMTSSHRFEAIISKRDGVGRVWFGPLQDDDSDLYNCDISITAERRREGRARAAIDLYESLGFVTTRRDDTDREMWVVVGPLST